VARVSVSKLKASLSEYLAKAQAGEEVVITSRNRPIARLLPAAPPEPPMVPFRELTIESPYMQELIRQGRLIVHGDGKIPKDFWDLPRAEDPEGLVLKALLEEREEGL
jgi:prevent-host-death family protein